MMDSRAHPASSQLLADSRLLRNTGVCSHPYLWRQDQIPAFMLAVADMKFDYFLIEHALGGMTKHDS